MRNIIVNSLEPKTTSFHKAIMRKNRIVQILETQDKLHALVLNEIFKVIPMLDDKNFLL